MRLDETLTPKRPHQDSFPPLLVIHIIRTIRTNRVHYLLSIYFSN